MPAALIVIVVVLFVSFFTEPLFRHEAISRDALWTIFYLGNWRFIESSSYFASDGTVSPLLHMWSLAVEEQFYVVWPLVLLGFMALVTKLKLKLFPALAILTSILIGVSFIGLVLTYDPLAPDRAYMGTDTKVFEPLIGALLAILTNFRTVNQWCRKNNRYLVWGGAGISLATFLVVDGPAPFYFYGGAFIFSLGVAMVIAGLRYGTGTPEARGLGHPVIAYLGRISYGLYLWHWPFAVWFGTHLEFHAGRSLLVIAATLIAAVISYHAIELPIRQGRISEMLPPRRAIGAGLISILTVAGFASQLGNATVVQAGGSESGPNRSVVMVIGDSVPSRMMTPLAKVGMERGYTVVSASKGGCNPLGVTLYLGEENNAGEACPEVNTLQADIIRDFNPGYILWWSRYDWMTQDIHGNILGPESEEFWTLLRDEVTAKLDDLSTNGSRIIYIAPERFGVGILDRPESEIQSYVNNHLLMVMITGDDSFP